MWQKCKNCRDQSETSLLVRTPNSFWTKTTVSIAALSSLQEASYIICYVRTNDHSCSNEKVSVSVQSYCICLLFFTLCIHLFIFFGYYLVMLILFLRIVKKKQPQKTRKDQNQRCLNLYDLNPTDNRKWFTNRYLI